MRTFSDGASQSVSADTLDLLPSEFSSERGVGGGQLGGQAGSAVPPKQQPELAEVESSRNEHQARQSFLAIRIPSSTLSHSPPLVKERQLTSAFRPFMLPPIELPFVCPLPARPPVALPNPDPCIVGVLLRWRVQVVRLS